MTLIKRADAIEAVRKKLQDWGGYAFEDYRRGLYEAQEIIEALPSAEAEPTVIRSRTLMPTKDFKEWAKRVREENPNAIIIPCDAEVVSAEAVQGEWIDWLGKGNEWECSVCRCSIESHGSIAYNFCPMCGARMLREDGEA